jgi:hypothetical protein
VRADKNKQINNPKLQDPTMLPTRNSIYLLIFAVLGIEFRALHMLNTYFITELHRADFQDFMENR